MKYFRNFVWEIFHIGFMWRLSRAGSSLYYNKKCLFPYNKEQSISIEDNSSIDSPDNYIVYIINGEAKEEYIPGTNPKNDCEYYADLIVKSAIKAHLFAKEHPILAKF